VHAPLPQFRNRHHILGGEEIISARLLRAPPDRQVDLAAGIRTSEAGGALAGL